MRTLFSMSLLASMAWAAAAADVRPNAEVTCQPTNEPLEYDCVIMLTDARTKAPLTGVTLVVGAEMPSMPMAHNVRAVQAEPGEKPGIYRARLKLEMAGTWAVRLDLSGALRDRVVVVMRFDDQAVPAGRAQQPD